MLVFLAISDQNATFIFSQNGRRQPFWMTEINFNKWEIIRFFSMESAGIKSQVDPALYIGGKVIRLHLDLSDVVTNVLKLLCAAECP